MDFFGVCLCESVIACVHVCPYVYVHVCLYVYVHVCPYVYVHVRVWGLYNA